jgi:C4-dicarboxylate-specific signal transduction histidine kinase
VANAGRQGRMAGMASESQHEAELILVVEDDAALRKLIEKRLAANGHRTAAVADGAAALAWLKQQVPRLMLLDYSLPDMRGEQLLEQIETLGIRVPFMVATGHGSESVAVEMMKRGACDYLIKGATFMKLLPAVVDQALERLRQADRLSRAEGQLRQARDELENRVEQRTAELAEVNRRLRVEMEERRRAEDQLQWHQAELAHVARLSTVGEMVAELAHELNQPLSAISSYAQACRRLLSDAPSMICGAGVSPARAAGTAASQDPARAAGMAASQSSEVVPRRPLSPGSPDQTEELLSSLNQVGEQADRAAEIIRRLRRFVKKTKPSQVVVDLNALIHEVAELMNIDAHMAKAEVAFELATPLPPVVGDRIQLEQVMVNLMRNGFESMRDSPHESRRLTIRATPDGGRNITVDVSDSGAGISPAEIERVFDRFFTTKADGMGLGLPISQSIIKNHGGTLWVTPNADRGSTFHFTLPIDHGDHNCGK